MPYQTITLSTAASSTPGASAAAALNWIGGKPITVSILPASGGGSSGAFTIQYTLDDIMRVPSSVVVWSGVSSAPALGLPGVTWNASAVAVDGVFLSFLSPIAAVRLNSSNLTGGPLLLKVLQGEGW